MFSKFKEVLTSPKYSKTLKLIFVLAIVAAIPLTVLIAQRQQEIRQRAGGPTSMPFPPSNFALKFSPSEATVKTGENFTVEILLDPGSNQVSGTDLFLSYNTGTISLAGFTASKTGYLNDTLINKIGIGTFQYAAVNTGSTLNNPYESFSLGTLTFKALTAGTAKVMVASVQVTALGQVDPLTAGNVSWGTYTVADQITPTSAPVTPTNTPAPQLSPTSTITPSSSPIEGDINNDNDINLLDFNIWRNEFLAIVTTKQADLNFDGKVDLIDFNIWRRAFNPVTPTSGQLSPTPTPVSQTFIKRVFVTSSTYDGDLKTAGSKWGLGAATNGLDGADKICQGTANTAKLGGAWKAWLSDYNTSASSRLTHVTIPYELVNGTVIANGWLDLTDGTLKNPISVTENGNTYYPGVWSGTLFSGDKYPVQSNSATCVDWATNYSGGVGRMGQAGSINFQWADVTQTNCSTALALYCFEQ